MRRSERAPDYDASRLRELPHPSPAARLGRARAREQPRRSTWIRPGFRERLHGVPRGCGARTTRRCCASPWKFARRSRTAGLGCLFLKGLLPGAPLLRGREPASPGRRRRAGPRPPAGSFAHRPRAARLRRRGTIWTTASPSRARLREIRGWAPAKAPHAGHGSPRRDQARSALVPGTAARAGRVAEESLWTAAPALPALGTGSSRPCRTKTRWGSCWSRSARISAAEPAAPSTSWISTRSCAPSTRTWDWERFCARQRKQGVLQGLGQRARGVLRALGLRCGDPRAPPALGQRLRLVELRDAEEALLLMERPRGSLLEPRLVPPRLPAFRTPLLGVEAHARSPVHPRASAIVAGLRGADR